jgi:uncharacterized delta-60 repeat protein/uncharacterized repeat protein (TIGR01451 family)
LTLLGALAWLGLTMGAMAQPLNDDFANAQILGNALTGVVGGANIDASRQDAAGEAFIVNNPGGQSVWYQWTAPQDVLITFDTLQSDFNTLLAVYIATNTPADLSNLVKVVENDDYGGNAQSLVTFSATSNTVYYITVDGYYQPPTAEGNIFIHWSPAAGAGAPAAGDFHFTTTLYMMSQNESVNPHGANMIASPDPLYREGRFVVTRESGSRGQVQVNYSITNLMYTNVCYAWTYGTNVFATNYEDLGQTMLNGFTNSCNTNEYVEYWVQDNTYGIFSTPAPTNARPMPGAFKFQPPLPWLLGGGLSITNINGMVVGPGSISVTNLGTNAFVFDCNNFNVTGPPVTNTTGSDTNYTFYTTNVFCIFTNYVYFVPTAFTNSTTFNNSTESNEFFIITHPRDYLRKSGQLIFDDYQMSADIAVDMAVPPNQNQNHFILHNQSFPFGAPVANRVIAASIDSVALGTNQFGQQESGVLPPTNSNLTLTHAIASVQDQTIVPWWKPDGNGAVGVIPFVRVPSTNVFNFERATIRCTEGIGTARVGVYRSTLLFNPVDCQYHIDYNFGNNVPNSWHRFRLPATGQRPGEGAPGAGAQGFSLDSDVELQAGSDYATPTNSSPANDPADFFPVDGQVHWDQNDNGIKFIDIPITNDALVEFNEDLLVQLYFPVTTEPPITERSLGNLNTCVLTIMFDDQPAGAVDRTHNPDFDNTTIPPQNAHPGADNSVYSIAIQPDGKTVIGGDFQAYNTVPINRIGRMNADGSKDNSFDPGDGADGTVTALALAADNSGKIYAGGSFTSINRISRARIARLNPNGSLDSGFDPGLGTDNTVWALVSETNDVLIAGEFGSFNSQTRIRIARLNNDGTLDTSFDPQGGPDNTVWAMLVQPDGKILIGGDFGNYNGVGRSHLARLNPDGSLDTSFDPQAGPDGTIYTMALQSDGKIIIGGAFANYGTDSRNGIARVRPDGLLDLSFNPGIGADDTVYTVALQQDGGILMGGIFTKYNQTRRVGIARLYTNGTLDTSFMDTTYNQFAGIPTHFFSTDLQSHNLVYSIGLQADGNVIIAGIFDRVGGGFTRDDIRNRNNVARLIVGATPGPGNISFAYNTYTADQFATNLIITVSRDNGVLGPVSARLSDQPLPAGPGAAILGTDYNFNSGAYGNPTWGATYPKTWQVQDSFGGTILTPKVDVLNHTSGNKLLPLQLSNPNGDDLLFMGGENVSVGVGLGTSAAEMTIVDYHSLAGALGFSAQFYRFIESTNMVVTVVRTNGDFGQVSVIAQTFNATSNELFSVGLVPNPALAGTNQPFNYRSNYTRLTFNDGVTTQFFVVSNINESTIEKDHSFRVHLQAPTGGATNFMSDAYVTMIDDDFVGGYAQFDSATYFTNENAGYAFINVTRNGGSAGTLSVQFAATNGTALNGTNFVAVTTNLLWSNGDVSTRTVPIRLLDDGIVNPANLFITNRLFNPTNNNSFAPSGLGSISNAVLVITNSDFRGFLAFSAITNFVNENGGPATISVIRSGGSAESISVNFAATPFSAGSGYFTPTNGTLVFGPGELSKSFAVAVTDDQVQAPNGPLTVALNLSGASPASVLGSPASSFLVIIDDEAFNEPPGDGDTSVDPSLGFNNDVLAMALQPDGKLLVGGAFTNANGFSRRHIARLNTDLSLDSHFSSVSPTAGADDSIFSIIAQTDQRIVIGGLFTSYNSVSRPHLARLTLDGSVDTTFNAGAGANGAVNVIAETFVGGLRKLLIGGQFTLMNVSPLNYLARLNDNGSVDNTFNIGSGANGQVFAIAVQPDGKTIVGGDFTVMAGSAASHIVRLNTDGTVDTTFNTGTGPNDSVRALAVQADGRILLGGLFTSVNGVALGHIGRLNANGTVDLSFNVGPGANDVVSTIALQPDTRIVLGGLFTLCNGVTRHRLTRLNSDGTVDPMINFGLGCDNFVAALAIQPDRRIVFGGGFSSYDGQPHSRLYRIYGGTVSGSGQFEFDSPVYQVDETGTNAVVTVRRDGGTAGYPNASDNVFITVTATNGTAVPGVNYFPLVTNLTFAPGEILKQVSITVTQDFAITPDLAVELALANPAPAGGPVFGNQPVAELTIFNDDSAVSLSDVAYQRNEDAPDGVATIPILRVGSTRGTASALFFTTTNGTALPFTNYIPTTNIVTFAPGQSSNIVQIPVIHDPTAQGDRTVQLELTNAVSAFLFSPSTALLTILDVERLPGKIMFGQTNYLVNEAAGSLLVTVVRTNGHSGSVSVQFSTVQGTALPGVKYVTTNGTLTFVDGETNKSFTVPIINNNTADGDVSFSLNLFNVGGGASITGPTNVPVTIIDDETGFLFASPSYVGSESAGTVSLTVLRQGNTNSALTVHYSTTNGLVITTNIMNGVTNVSTNIGAIAGINYVGVTNGTLSFTNGESAKGFAIQLLHTNAVTGDLPFNVSLFNPQAPAQLVAPATATVVVLDSESWFLFTNTILPTFKSATNLLVTVVRSNANTGQLTVGFGTTNGTAVAGVDYTPVSGTLVFSNGVAMRSFSVPIINNLLIQGDKYFTVYVTNATPTNIASLLTPSRADVWITNDVSGVSYSSSFYSVNENGVSAPITVTRSGYTSNTVSVDFSTSDGSAVAGVNYLANSGTLVFTNGETTKVFQVFVRDDGVVTEDNTVLLSLNNVQGNATLVNPPSATLDIHEVDGSLILPAGSVLSSETGPVNGVIDSNETVTVQLALRNASGSNTLNLQATLLTNANILPSGLQSQNYGSLLVRGPSAFRPFSFKAMGTNGQPIAVTLALKDGGTVFSNAVFNFTLGNPAVTFSNNAAIVINDATNATPYPSMIHVSEVNGVVAKATVTVSNLYHTWPGDIDMLLVSPAGQKSYLMAKCGGGNSISRVTLTFDDSGSPLGSGVIVSGTNHPTSLAAVTPAFPIPAPPGPYNTNLAAFNGGNPNGDWVLYVFDDSPVNTGIISNGWSLKLTPGVPAAADIGLSMLASSSNIVAGNSVTFTIGVTNYGPSTASNVVVSDTLPVSAIYVSSSAGGSTNVPGLVTWPLSGTLPANSFTNLSVTVQLNTPGSATNSVGFTAGTTDANPDDDAAVVVVNVAAPTADLVLSMVGVPNPVLLGNYVTNTLTVSNAGPATAIAVGLTNTIPAAASFSSATPAGYTQVGNVVTFGNLGSLASGARTNVTIVIRPLSAGTITNTAQCASSVTDPAKANNLASVKTVVEQMAITRSGGNIVVAWPTDVGNYQLYSTTNLRPPVVWSLVTSPPIQTVGNQNTVTIPIGPGVAYFRLRSP